MTFGVLLTFHSLLIVGLSFTLGAEMLTLWQWIKCVRPNDAMLSPRKLSAFAVAQVGLLVLIQLSGSILTSRESGWSSAWPKVASAGVLAIVLLSVVSAWIVQTMRKPDGSITRATVLTFCRLLVASMIARTWLICTVLAIVSLKPSTQVCLMATLVAVPISVLSSWLLTFPSKGELPSRDTDR